MNQELGVYPDINSPDFYKNITIKKEFWDNRINNPNKDVNCLQPQQRLLANFINPMSPYNSIMINAAVGTGKTLTSIAIAENFKNDYKIIVILKSEILEHSYRNELITNLCTVYGQAMKEAKYNHENKIFNDVNDIKDIISNIKKQINKHYNFITYNDLVNNALGKRIPYAGIDKLKSVQRHQINSNYNLNNTVVIVDEAHNITGIPAYDVLLELLSRSTNTKLILMTATPIIDNIKEIFELSNLLNAKNPELQFRNGESHLIKDGFIKKNKTIKIKSAILSDTSNNITELGKKSLEKALRGKISYLETKHGFAKKIYRGTKLNTHKNSNTQKKSSLKSHLKSSVKSNLKSIIRLDADSDIHINKTKMSVFQKTVYAQTLLNSNLRNILFKNSIDASTIVYPDKSYGKEGYLKNIIKSTDLSFLKKENIKKYSSKLFSILENIDKSKGPCFIYSNYVNHGGTDLISIFLSKNGYSKYKISNKSSNKPKTSFIVLKGDTGKRIQTLLHIFNDPTNKYGDNIKIVIGSPIVAEGINLKYIRQIHLLEPSWNMSKIDQIIGRGVRFEGHSELLPNERCVEIFLHAAIDTESNSIDFLIYQLEEKKDESIKEIEYILKKIAIDCYLNKPVNLKKNSIDYSRECQYQKCKYSCMYEPPKNFDIDYDTYSLKYHSLAEYKYIMKWIKHIFKIGFIYTIDFIIKYIKNKNKQIHENNIYIVISDIIKSKMILLNKNNQKSTIVNKNNFYIIQPIDKKSPESLYFNIHNVIPNKVINFNINNTNNLNYQTPIKKIKKINVIKKLNAHIYGTLINKFGIRDDLFRIVHNRNNNNSADNSDNSDKRSSTNGKECRFYTKKDLIVIANKLNLNDKSNDKNNDTSKSKSKEQLCSLIFNHLKNKNLIVT